MLRDYTLVLEITPTRPLAHGEGAVGNVQLFRRIKIPIERDGQWIEEEIPEVSGAALKSALREEGAYDILRTCEIDPTKDQLRFLMKGGRLSKGGGNSVNLDAMRKIAELAPIMSVMGAMDDSYSRPGKIRVGSVQPWCKETVEAGLAPRRIRALTVLVDGKELSGGGETVELYPGKTPIPLHMSTQVIERFAHDMMSSPKGRVLLERGGMSKEIEDKSAALRVRRDRGEKVKSKEKVSEAMPYSYEVISPGTPMWTTITLQDATVIEWGFLLSSIWMWISKGAYLGGGRREDWGRCRVRISGAIEHETPIGTMPVSPGTKLSLSAEDPNSAAVLAYRQHLVEHAADIRTLVGGM